MIRNFEKKYSIEGIMSLSGYVNVNVQVKMYSLFTPYVSNWSNSHILDHHVSILSFGPLDESSGQVSERHIRTFTPTNKDVTNNVDLCQVYSYPPTNVFNTLQYIIL